LRSDYLEGEQIQTIYIGGGTPSLLEIKELLEIFKKLYSLFEISSEAEITIELNPDDITASYLEQLKEKTPINRISIGIQSFSDKDLKMLNRRHNSCQAHRSIDLVRDKGYNNIGIDLIYGLPGMDSISWKMNIDKAFNHSIDHISAYHLGIEAGTVLKKLIEKGTLVPVDEEESYSQYLLLCSTAAGNGYEHYEISNFCKPGMFSRHNTNYWNGKKYLGAGPSAHSFNQKSRQWNLCSTDKYISAINNGDIFYETEFLNKIDRLNEFIMLSLRTKQGINIQLLKQMFGDDTEKQFKPDVSRFVDTGQIIINDIHYYINERSWFISDHIISSMLQDES